MQCILVPHSLLGHGHGVMMRRRRPDGWSWRCVGFPPNRGGLANGTTYDIEVLARNEAGQGPPLRHSATPRTKSGPPLNLAAAGVEELVVTWDPPEDNGGSPVTRYELRWHGPGEIYSSQRTVHTTGTSHTIPNLTKDTTYSLRVAAQTSAGWGHRAVIAARSTGTPDAPQDVRLLRTADRAALSWSPPRSDGGEPVTAYRVQWRTADQEFDSQRQATTAALEHALDSLDADSGYTVRVIAVNSVGDGPSSPELTAAFPSEPQNLQVTAARRTLLSVTWEPSTSNGGPEIAEYVVQWKSAGEDYSETERYASVAPSTQPSYSIGGLVAHTEYTVRVVARNTTQVARASPEAPGTPVTDSDLVRQFIKDEVVDYDWPTGPHRWLQATWEQMEQRDAEIRTIEPGSALVLWHWTRVYPNELYTMEFLYLQVWRDMRDRATYVHEMAHMYTLGSGWITDPQVAQAVAVGHMYFASLAKGGRNCTSEELYADAIAAYVMGSTGQYLTGYWLGCSNTPRSPTVEALDVVAAVLNGEIPDWFVENFHDENGAVDLEEVWAAIKDRWTFLSRTAAVWALRDAWGDYCNETRAKESVPISARIGNVRCESAGDHHPESVA